MASSSRRRCAEPVRGATRRGHAVGEGHQAGAVPRAQRDVEQEQRAVDGVVELGQRPGAHAHEPALVETCDHRLVALGGELGGHQPPGAGGGPPVDVAQRVIGHGLAHSLELRPLAMAADGPHTQLLELAAACQRLVDAHGGDVRVDAHGERVGAGEVTRAEAPPAHRAHVHAAERRLTAGAGRQRVRRLARASQRHVLGRRRASRVGHRRAAPARPCAALARRG